jgi:hypothetical protein
MAPPSGGLGEGLEDEYDPGRPNDYEAVCRERERARKEAEMEVQRQERLRQQEAEQQVRVLVYTPPPPPPPSVLCRVWGGARGRRMNMKDAGSFLNVGRSTEEAHEYERRQKKVVFVLSQLVLRAVEMSGNARGRRRIWRCRGRSACASSRKPSSR